jgi:hypothetical protein
MIDMITAKSPEQVYQWLSELGYTYTDVTPEHEEHRRRLWDVKVHAEGDGMVRAVYNPIFKDVRIAGHSRAVRTLCADFNAMASRDNIVKQAPNRRITQITASGSDGDIWALCDDGTLWYATSSHDDPWARIPNVPQD